MSLVLFLLSCAHTPELTHGMEVHCPLTEAFPDGLARFAEYDVSGACLLTQDVTIRNGEVTLPVIQLAGAGSLTFAGSPSLSVEWSNFHCDYLEPPPSREVCGVVAATLGSRVTVRVSDGEKVAVSTTDRKGNFCVLADGEPLDVEASRWDGQILVKARSDWAPGAGERVAVGLPEQVQGGVGLLLEPTPAGLLRVVRVVKGMAAAKAGIVPGTVLSVDEASLGAVGTLLHAKIVTDEALQPIDLKRSVFSEDPAWDVVTLPGEVLMGQRAEGLVL